MPMKSLLAPICLAIALIVFGTCAQASASIADRGADPVVLTGSDVPKLKGVAAVDVVAFGWDEDWYQLPVQVDERKLVNPRSLYPFPDSGFVQSGAGFQIEAYSDPGTLVGKDPDPSLDDNDEIAVMSYDTGFESDAGFEPDGVIPGSGVTVKVTDPVDGDSSWLYLFESDGSLDPAAESEYLSYDFSLDALGAGGSLIDDYGYAAGPNPEDSFVVTAYYDTHSSDRWVDDSFTISDEIENPVDILDRDKVLFAPGDCQRSEDTFSSGEGSFIANINGPVRAIRSYIGANSGPYTQRDHIYYEQREDIRTYVRVHGIPQAIFFLDYSPEATGMTYRNELNPAGVTIDGVPDPSLVPGVPSDIATDGSTWEQVTGSQGTLNVVTSIRTDAPNLRYGSYYLDDKTPGTGSETQCTGDAFAYGSSGVRITSAIPNTDPKDPPASSLTSTRSLYFTAPGGTAEQAAALAKQAVAPLQTRETQVLPGTGGGVDGSVLRMKVRPALRKAEPGRTARFKITLKNTGNLAAMRLKICVKPAGKLAGAGCFNKADLGAGNSRSFGLRLRVRGSARPGRTYAAKIAAKALDTKPVKGKVKVRVPIR